MEATGFFNNDKNGRTHISLEQILYARQREREGGSRLAFFALSAFFLFVKIKA